MSCFLKLATRRTIAGKYLLSSSRLRSLDQMPRGGVNLIPLIRATFAGLFRVNCQTLGCHARPALDGTIRWKSNAPSLAPRDFHPDPFHTQSYWPFHPFHPAIYSSIPSPPFVLLPSSSSSPRQLIHIYSLVSSFSESHSAKLITFFLSRFTWIFCPTAFPSFHRKSPCRKSVNAHLQVRLRKPSSSVKLRRTRLPRARSELLAMAQLVLVLISGSSSPTTPSSNCSMLFR